MLMCVELVSERGVSVYICCSSYVMSQANGQSLSILLTAVY